MRKTFFRKKWEPYFSSFTDNELFALKFMVSEMHRKATWFTNVGRARVQAANDGGVRKRNRGEG